MERKVRILVVEDDSTLCEMLKMNLEFENYEVDTAFCAEDALRLDLSAYSLVLLDVMMKEISGFSLAKRMKESPNTASVPIIFCTARDTEDDMVTGLTLGADDYIYKPYTMRNVLTRVKTVLRRFSSYENKTGKDSRRLVNGGIELDLKSKRCFVDGTDAKLVKKEFEVLSLLMRHPDTVFSRDEILNNIWEENENVFDRTVDVNITRIRQKIAPYSHRVVTRQGYGYVFE